MTRKIAIIGDHFILPEVFESELLKTCFEYNLDCRLRLEDWPNSPVTHGYDGRCRCSNKRVYWRF